MPKVLLGRRALVKGCLLVPVAIVVAVAIAALVVRLKGPSHGYPPDCRYYIAGCIDNDLAVARPGRMYVWTGQPFVRLPSNRVRPWAGLPWDISASTSTICYTAVAPQGSGNCVEVATFGGKVLHTLPSFSAFSLAFNRSGDKVGMVGNKGETYPYHLYVWDLKTGAFDCIADELATYGSGTLTTFSWLDDRTIVATFPRQSIESIDIVTRKRTVIVAMGVAPCISPDGRYMAYNKASMERDWQGSDTVVRDLSTGAEVKLSGDIQGHDEMVWTPDSAFVAYGDTSGLLRRPCITLQRISDGKRYIIHDYSLAWDTSGVTAMRFVSDATLAALAQGAAPAAQAPQK